MNKDDIIETLQSFSEMHKFEYDCDPLPYIPFGGMRGIVQDSIFYMYVRRIESEVEGSYHTVFGISNRNILPKGFCIENIGHPDRKGKQFKDQISVLSYDEKFANKTLNNRVKSEIVKYFDELERKERGSQILNIHNR